MFKDIDKKNIVRAAGIILYRNSEKNKDQFEFLMGVRTDCNKLCFPAGHIDKGEGKDGKYLDTALRELHEETGYRFKDYLIDSLYTRAKSGKTISSYKNRLNFSNVYFIKIKNSDLILDNKTDGELKNVRFYSISEIIDHIYQDKIFIPSLISFNLIYSKYF